MEKIKDVTKVLLPTRAMLVEIIEPKRMIISPDGTTDQDSYCKIVAVHETVTDLVPGDIAIKVSGTMYAYKVGSKSYAIVYRDNINIAVKADNFIDPDKITEKVNV
jgi:hypothetical protein